MILTCSACANAKPADAFAIAPGGSRRVKCIECTRASLRAATQRYREAHPDRVKASARRHIERNPGIGTEYSRRWKAKNPERVRAYVRDYWARNPDKRRHYDRTKWAKRRQQIGHDSVSMQKVKWRIEMFGGRCWVCNGPSTAIDHVKPLAKGGRHIAANMRPICTSCNSRKKAKWPFKKEQLHAA